MQIIVGVKNYLGVKFFYTKKYFFGSVNDSGYLLAALCELVDRLNALVLINGIEGYQNLISDINTRFEKFEQLVLQRQGRAAKNKTVAEVK